MSPVHLGQLPLGRIPRVVGAIEGLSSARAVGLEDAKHFDIAEIRLREEETEGAAWQSRVESFDEMGVPTILTLRLASEGGTWIGPEARRAAVFRAALEQVAAIDVEMESPILGDMVEAAHASKRVLIGSFHDFEQTPGMREFDRLVERALEHRVDVLKIATMIADPRDVWPLLDLLRKTEGAPLLCLIGMGALGASSRYFLPTLGSCLAYGAVDAPTAPGQPSCRRLTEYLRENMPSFNQEAVARKAIMKAN